MKKRIKKFLRKIAIFVYGIMVKKLPIADDVIVFESSVGRNCTGNARAIHEEMVRQGLDKKYRIIWSLESDVDVVPGWALKVRRTRLKYLYYMAIAKVWVSDSRMPKWLIKREGNTYIQTWHGTPLKKLALDMDVLNMGGSTDVERYHNNFIENTKTWDYLISQNSFSTETFRRCFAFDKEILEIGYPRNDILLQKKDDEYIKKLKKQLDLPLDKKIILYAPTWRDDQYHDKSIYKFATEMKFSAMKERLSDEYALIVKFHYLVKDRYNWKDYRGFVYEFGQHFDITELYLVSDMLITDYSSVMFDYSLLRRPMFFYAYDYENYKNNLRGFYFDFLATAPGPVVKTTEELIESILNYDENEWKEKYQTFIETYNHADDGHASEKVVQVIKEKMQEN